MRGLIIVFLIALPSIGLTQSNNLKRMEALVDSMRNEYHLRGRQGDTAKTCFEKLKVLADKSKAIDSLMKQQQKRLDAIFLKIQNGQGSIPRKEPGAYTSQELWYPRFAQRAI